jgi:hypothetical protein
MENATNATYLLDYSYPNVHFFLFLTVIINNFSISQHLKLYCACNTKTDPLAAPNSI